MAPWFLVLFPFFIIVEPQCTAAIINQTDLQVAMADMRAKSYHGFVILLKIFNGTSDSLSSTGITFLMPNDEKLSGSSLRSDLLHEFILSHSIPTPLVYNNMLHFPNGTLIPSSLPGRLLNITNSGKSGMFLNNAKIVTSNVCVNSLIKCHGISSEVAFDNDLSLPINLLNNLSTTESKVPLKTNAPAKSSPSAHPKRRGPIH
ncbi:uncharacterized protein LOC123216380 [Mangifera indica]|uniref:uncharacterized protein LOC123216380 n=1 Tax=Mangifera indica TaxID=29780 RepID=UPI001CFBAD0C|nr:uncharacterized protein LOC123216380 [Mangifera indica]